MRRIALLVLLFASPAVAQSPQTVLIRNGGIQGSGVICGGTADGKFRAVLSVQHVVGDPGNRVIVSVPNAKNRYRGTVVKSETISDAALVVIKGDHLDHIPNAKLWTGEITNRQLLRTEGYASGRYRETAGMAFNVHSAQVGWSAPAYPGMSGGPTYLVDHPGYFLATSSTSNLRSASWGPHRSYYKIFVQTCTSPTHSFQFRDGLVHMQPRVLEGPLEPTTAPQGDSLAQSPDLRRELLDALREYQGRPRIDPDIADT